MKTLTVSEMMTIRPKTCKCDDSITEASKLLKKYDISSLIIIDKEEVKGILTVEDIVTKVVAEDKDPQKTKTRDVMIKNVINCQPQDPIEKVIETMNINSISQVPIMEGAKLVGFVTIKDILRLEPAMFEFFMDRLHVEEEKRKNFIHKYKY